MSDNPELMSDTEEMDGKPTIAYIISRFPKITETFILYEMVALEKLGLRIELFPLLLQDEKVQHAEAQSWVARAQTVRWHSFESLASQLYWLAHKPSAYIGMWWSGLWGNRASLKFLIRAVAALYLSAAFARRIIQDERIKHIHAHWATHAALAAYGVHRLTGIPYSFTGHAHDLYVDRSMLEEKIRRAAFVVTISEYNKAFLEKLYGRQVAKKTHVVHCGVNTEMFISQNNPTTSIFTLICIAGLEPKKGHRYLIEACALLKQRGLSFRCLLVGDGPERRAIEDQIRGLNLDNTVQLLGQLDHDSTQKHIQDAHLMVLPSVRLETGKQEGIPVALMEALAMGLPAIASDISGVPELIEDEKTGLLVPERDPEALADAISRIYNDRGLGARLGAAGRAKVVEAFDLHRSAAALKQLFILSSRGEKVTLTADTNPRLVGEQT